MTNQQAFDKIVARLMDGAGRAVTKNNTCVYRAPNGLKCAVGCLIPDDEYSKDMEGNYVVDLQWAISSGLDLELLSYLQYIHDEPDLWDGNNLTSEGMSELQQIAQGYNLTMPDIDNA